MQKSWEPKTPSSFRIRNLKKEEGLLDSAIVFAPSDKAIDAAIRSVKKGGIGTRKDMADLVRLASDSGLQVVIEKRRLAEANEVLAKLKKSQVEARAVLVP